MTRRSPGTDARDPRTPVIVGAGQFSERIGEPDHPGRSVDDLLTSDDSDEGTRAFPKKRTPHWRDR